MSASVASKNIFELLGNDSPEDEPTPAPREVIKATTSSKKRDEKVAPVTAPRGNGRGGRGRLTGSEQAYRDRDAGRDNNRSKPATEEGAPSSHPRGGRGRGRSGGNRREFDRHSGTGKEEHEKQVEHGWGGKTGEKEWSDELAGAELAQKDAAGVDASGADTNANTEGAEGAATTEEEEEKVKTYDDYLAELAARQANLGPRTEVRRPNEGTREDKKWANAKPLPKVEGEGEYFIGESKDKTRNRERKGKQLLDIELRFVDQNKRGGGERGSGRGRGSDRGGRGGRGDRSAPRSDRGNRGGKVSTINVNIDVNIHDSSTFPALGA